MLGIHKYDEGLKNTHCLYVYTLLHVTLVLIVHLYSVR